MSAAAETTTRLTLAYLAPIFREAIRDKSYRSTPLGLTVGRYLRYMRSEYGATPDTLRSYESILARFAIVHADLELSDFEPPVGTERIREFIDDQWGALTASTRATVTSVLKSFFRWAYELDLVNGDPTAKIRRPRKRAPQRRAHNIQKVRAIMAAQPLRDRAAVGLMAYLGLRKSEVRLLRWRDIDLERGDVVVHGKGGKIVAVPLAEFAELHSDLAALSILDGAQPDHYVLYPVRVGNVQWSKGASGVVREYRDRPMQPSTMHRWWARCLDRAGAAHFPMHELRHTAITEFIRATGDLALARMFARHATVATTVDIYGHLDQDDLVRGMRLTADRWKE